MVEILGMTDKLEKYRALMDSAEKAILAAYWTACDSIEGPVDPAKLTDTREIEEFLQDAYDSAMRMEDMVKTGKAADWKDAGDYF